MSGKEKLTTWLLVFTENVLQRLDETQTISLFSGNKPVEV